MKKFHEHFCPCYVVCFVVCFDVQCEYDLLASPTHCCSMVVSCFLQGGVVLVSHDARLICEAGCELWVVDNKTVTRFEGEFDDYRDSLLEQIEEDAEAAKRKLELKLEKRKQERAEKLIKAKERSDRARLKKQNAASATQ